MRPSGAAGSSGGPSSPLVLASWPPARVPGHLRDPGNALKGAVIQSTRRTPRPSTASQASRDKTNSREKACGRKGPFSRAALAGGRGGGLPAAGSEHWPLRGRKTRPGPPRRARPTQSLLCPAAPAQPSLHLVQSPRQPASGTPGARPQAARPCLVGTRDFGPGSQRPSPGLPPSAGPLRPPTGDGEADRTRHRRGSPELLSGTADLPHTGLPAETWAAQRPPNPEQPGTLPPPRPRCTLTGASCCPPARPQAQQMCPPPTPNPWAPQKLQATLLLREPEAQSPAAAGRQSLGCASRQDAEPPSGSQGATRGPGPAAAKTDPQGARGATGGQQGLSQPQAPPLHSLTSGQRPGKCGLAPSGDRGDAIHL